MQQLPTSRRGLADIARAEGLSLCVYRDLRPDGSFRFADGIGNNDDNLRLDNPLLTIEQVLETFFKNMVRFDAVVDRTITRLLQQNQKDALASRAFNAGVRGFEVGEAALIERVNANDNRGVTLELVRDANLNRRIREAGMYVSGDYRDLYMVGAVRHPTPMVPLFRADPKDPKNLEWIPLPKELAA